MDYNYRFIDSKQQSTNEHQPYIYPTLEKSQIRLLKLHSGTTNCPLTISLQQYDSCASCCSYEAVSYVWGDPERNVKIICNGVEQKITTSLEIALRYLRLLSRDRVLWIDAICINQDNIEERAQQVLLMGGIYSRAAKVLIWIGESDKTTKLAFRAIHKWASFNRRSRDNFGHLRFSDFEQHFISKPEHRFSLAAVGTLTHRSWFNRCWTFQEILLSKDAEIMVGELRLTWESFHFALVAFPVYSLVEEVLNFNALFMCYGKAKIKKSISSENPASISPNLSMLLQMTRNFVASNPRDKIFSMLGLATLRNRDLFKPHYEMSVRDTFISFTLAMIRDENSLNILCSAGELGRDKGLPSWCPDWTCKRNATLIRFDNYVQHSTSHDHDPGLQNLRMNECCELELEGVLIDVVKETIDLEELLHQLKSCTNNGTFFSVLSRFAYEFGLQNCLSLDTLTLEGVLIRALTADHWYFSTQISEPYKEQWFPIHTRIWGFLKSHSTDDLIQVTMLRYNSPTPVFIPEIETIYSCPLPFAVKDEDLGHEESIPSSTRDGLIKETVDQILFFSKGRRILLTQNGLVALGTGSSKVGDILCSFRGGDIPFLIRRRNEPDQQGDTIPVYQIIGECYINGLTCDDLSFRSNEEEDGDSPIHPDIDWLLITKFRVS